MQVSGAVHVWLEESHFGRHLGLHRIPSFPEYPSGHGPHVMNPDDGDDEELDKKHSTPAEPVSETTFKNNCCGKSFTSKQIWRVGFGSIFVNIKCTLLASKVTQHRDTFTKEKSYVTGYRVYRIINLINFQKRLFRKHKPVLQVNNYISQNILMHS